MQISSAATISDYHTDCPLDHMLLDWKGVPYADIKKEIVGGADDDALAEFLDANGTKKTLGRSRGVVGFHGRR